jgi:DNA-binding transcriptional LysR family regulator
MFRLIGSLGDTGSVLTIAMPPTVGAAAGELKHRSGGDLHSADVDADLRLLRYFVAVAEELHFTRAAARLHMTQQPLSAAIRRLEADLGVQLFDRTTRRVELTDAGRALLEPARSALQAAEDALAAARATGQGVAGELRFGRSHGARYGLEALFATLAERHPALRLRIRQDSNASLLADVRDGQLDLAVTFCARIPAELEHERLKDEPVVAAVAATHPLADRETIALHELRGETFALDASGENRDYDDAIVETCRRSGFEPRTRATAEMHDAWFEVIGAEGCVGLTTRSSIHVVNRDLRLLDLQEPPAFPIDLVWRAPPRPTVHAVVATARAVRDSF